MIHKRKLHSENRGIGMTSQGTRDRLVQTLRQEGIEDERVLKAITQVPRHKFVDEALSSRAYENTALPIGQGQTISQPWIVARMTEAIMDGGQPEKVLEVGTGSGYQAAILAKIVREVYTIEIKEKLYEKASRLMASLEFTNVKTRHADGYFGWPEAAPFDAVMITAAVNHIPPPLLKQLDDGGRLILPLGNPFSYQNLTLITKTGGDYITKQITGVLFVPMTGHALEK